VQRIRAYVSDGGSYLGLCAGAYFAAARCEFEAGSALEVVGARELAFYGGTAHGSVSPHFAYGEDDSSAVAARVLFPGTTTAPERLDDLAVCYLNGGCEFIPPAEGALAGVAVLARYAAGSHGDGGIAAVRCHVGEGVAVLSGPHPEMAPKWLGTSALSATLLNAELSVGDSSRIRLWRCLLRAARMPLVAREENDEELLPPPSPLRSIAPGLVLPIDADVALANNTNVASAAVPTTAQTPRTGNVALGPLRSTSTLDLQAFPELPGACILANRISEAGDGCADDDSINMPPWGRVSAPLPRLVRWSSATAGMLALSALLHPRAPRASRTAGVVAGACACALGAGVRFGRPRRGVPITAQTLAACLAGLVLGPTDGVRATALYATAAVAGLPVLSPSPPGASGPVTHAPSAGFVAGFLLCAAATGRARDVCIRHRATRSQFGAAVFAAACAGQLSTVLLGAAWATVVLAREGVAFDAAMGGVPRPWLLELAVHSMQQVPPFAPGMAVKAAITAVVAAIAAPTLVGPPPAPQPALRRLLE